jgi:endonuclease YncB( thermonuclease family)
MWGSAMMMRWIFRVVVLATIVQQAGASPIDPQRIRVIDGDTIATGGKTVHLVGFIAPEIQGAQCRAERELGAKAAHRVRDLVSAGGLDYSPVPCSCPTTILGKWACRFARTCGSLKADGHDVGDILVAEGLAIPFSCDGIRCSKAQKPWCKT